MTQALPMNLGERLRRERERRHWTQGYLAAQIGAAAISVIRWENGQVKPHADMVKALIGLFDKPIEAWGASRARVWTVPYLRNLHFTGRDRILTHLHTVLSGQNIVAVSQARTISGLGGIGKTQTALEYAYRYREEYDLVLWVRADSREALLAQFAGLAVHFGLPNHAQADQHRLAQAVKRWLEAQQEQAWLLIFDNVDDIALVQEFVPTSGNGAVLLTTRLHAVGKHLRKIELDKLSLEEGAQFLLTRKGAAGEEGLEALPAAEREAAEQLCTLMDGLPLALDQAAAYIEEHGCSLAEYVALYQQQRATFLSLPNTIDKRDYPNSVATTWLLSFQRVKQANPAAVDLLRLLAFLHPDAIPEELLVSGAGELGPSLQAMAENPARLRETIGLVQKHSLVRHNAETKMLSIHRMVQAVIQDGLDAAQTRQWAERAVRLVGRAFPEAEYAHWERCEQLLPHVLVCASHIKKWEMVFPEAALLLHRAGEYLFHRTRYGEALALSQQALAIREQVLPPIHPDVAESLNNVAFFYGELGQHREAQALFQRALAIWEQALGPNDPLVALCLNNVAEMYRHQGQYAAALPLYQRALAIDEQAYGTNHPDVATDVTNLALLYQAQGQYAAALPLFQRALAIWEASYGPTHPLVVRSLSNLGGIYRAQGQYEQALQYLERARSTGERELGATHPYVAQTLNHLGGISREQGQYAEAQKHLQRALAIREQELGPNHPDVAASLTNLALLYKAKRQYGEALPLFQRALAILEQALRDHPDTATCREDLADLLREMGAGGAGG